MVSSVSSTGSSSLSGVSSSSNISGNMFLTTLLENFAASFDKTDESEDADELKEQIKSLVSEADTDENGGLSLDELSSVDTSNDSDKAEFVNDLISQFKSLDENGDGELSISEMQKLAKQKQFSAQELKEMSESFASSSTFGADSKNMSSAVKQQFLSIYQNCDLSDSTSSISVST